VLQRDETKTSFSLPHTTPPSSHELHPPLTFGYPDVGTSSDQALRNIRNPARFHFHFHFPDPPVCEFQDVTNHRGNAVTKPYLRHHAEQPTHRNLPAI